MSPLSSDGKVSFRPNNYRRRIVCHDLSHARIRGSPPLTTFISDGKGNNHIFVKGLYPRITLQVGKRTITAIYDQHDAEGRKESFQVPAIGGVRAKVKEIEGMLDAALRDFSQRIGIVGDAVPISTWHEDGIMGEPFIDSLPKEMILQAGGVTKLYGEGIEFKGSDEPGVRAERYLRNASLREFAPEIARALEWIAGRLEGLGVPAVQGVAEPAAQNAYESGPSSVESLFERARELVLSWPEDVFLPEVRELVRQMSGGEREEFSAWTFDAFRGVMSATRR